MQFTYPAVFYYDEEFDDYAVEFSDICIYAEGDTMEEAHQNAQEYLLAYLETCEELKIAPNPPNTYESTLKNHPNGEIMLVTVDYTFKKDKNKKAEAEANPKEENIYADIHDDIVEDIAIGMNDGDNPALKFYLKSKLQEEGGGEVTVESRQSALDNDTDGGDDDFGLPEIEE